MTRIETERLILRQWKPEDVQALTKINADPRVMEFLGPVMSEAETAAMIEIAKTKFDLYGFCFSPVELKHSGEVIGFVGLSVPSFETHFTPCVEIGWRLGHAHWGKGYATEAAFALLRFGFEQKGLQEIVSFTTERNVRSRRVMERLGMTYDPSGDFDHPKLAEDHPLRRHVLYRISQTKG